LSSAAALYSSGPVTPGMRNRPALSWCPSERHNRAVATSRSVATVRSNAASPVARTYRTAAAAMSALMWNAAVPAGQYAEHSWPRSVRQGNAAPARPRVRALANAKSMMECRQRSASAAAFGWV
jgi:hypothetical protein